MFNTNDKTYNVILSNTQVIFIKEALLKINVDNYIKQNKITEDNEDMLTGLKDMLTDMLNNNISKDFDTFVFTA